MMSAVIFLAKESEESAAGESTPTQTESIPAETRPTQSNPTGSGTVTSPPAPTPSPEAVAKGKGLYTSLGCIGCHSLDGSAGTGPTFKGLYNSQVKLDDGSTVAADDDYLTRAIQDPDAQIVTGHQPGIMSAVIKPHSVSDENTQALIAYIASVK
jgi:cytochrome c oxidase subunit 2